MSGEFSVSGKLWLTLSWPLLKTITYLSTIRISNRVWKQSRLINTNKIFWSDTPKHQLFSYREFCIRDKCKCCAELVITQLCLRVLWCPLAWCWSGHQCTDESSPWPVLCPLQPHMRSTQSQPPASLQSQPQATGGIFCYKSGGKDVLAKNSWEKWNVKFSFIFKFFCEKILVLKILNQFCQFRYSCLKANGHFVMIWK